MDEIDRLWTTHVVIRCLRCDLLYDHWLPRSARLRCRSLAVERLGRRHAPALYGGAPYGGGAVRDVLVLRGGSLASVVLAGVSLLTKG